MICNENLSVKENIKLTVLDNDEDCEKSYFEIVINRNCLNTLLISLLLTNSLEPEFNSKFTQREKEVLTYISKGLNNQEIADKMNVSIHTSKIHIKNIFEKIGAKDRTEAVVKAIKYNIINIYS